MISGGLAGYVGGLIGKIIGIYLFSIFFNYFLKIILKKDSISQKIIAVAISATLYILIPTFLTNKTNNIDEIVGFNLGAIFGWFITNSFYALKFRIKKFVLSLLYGILFYIISSFGIGIIVAFIQIFFNFKIYNSLVGIIMFTIGLVISSSLVYKGILPGSKTKHNFRTSS